MFFRALLTEVLSGFAFVGSEVEVSGSAAAGSDSVAEDEDEELPPRILPRASFTLEAPADEELCGLVDSTSPVFDILKPTHIPS